MILDDIDGLIDVYEISLGLKARYLKGRALQSIRDIPHLLKTDPTRLGSSVLKSVKPGVTNMLGTGATHLLGYGVDHKGLWGAAKQIRNLTSGQTKRTPGNIAGTLGNVAWNVMPSNPALELTARTAPGVKNASKGWRLATRREGLNPDVQKALYRMNSVAI